MDQGASFEPGSQIFADFAQVQAVTGEFPRGSPGVHTPDGPSREIGPLSQFAGLRQSCSKLALNRARKPGISGAQAVNESTFAVDQAVVTQPGKRIVGIVIEPGATAAEAKAVTPGIHIGKHALAAKSRDFVRQ